MIELTQDSLNFTFPDVHPSARLSINFQRTLRIPDDDKIHSLPPGLGNFPLHHVDDHSARIPADWIRHGGVMLPMYQSEAMWLCFDAGYDDDRNVPYPFAIKIAAGKINAVSGDDWSDGLHRKPQDYAVAPEQPWLDGFNVGEGVIRQFVAMPLGAGYTAEEQITGAAEHGGLQVQVYPMKRAAFEKRFEKGGPSRDGQLLCCMSAPSVDAEMGLAPGGRMKQDIYDDPYRLNEWDLDNSSRCFIHIANSLVWEAITGATPPTVPPTAEQYTRAGLPWFDYYDDALALKGADQLAKLKSVLEMGRQKGDVPLPENESVTGERVVKLRKRSGDEVRQGSF